MLAAIELGGTNCVAARAIDGTIVDEIRIATEGPGPTLGKLAGILAGWNSDAPFRALSIASFGPVGIQANSPTYGMMLDTPKPGWSGASVLSTLAGSLTCPVSIDLDVNAAALGERRCGAAHDLEHFAYVTVGTGIGIALVNDGRLVNGRMHPEAGHMRIPRRSGDDFAGNCQFHGDCLAGLVAGPAISDRAGRNGRDIGDDDPVWEDVARDLGVACANLITTLALEAVVIGGGVALGRTFLVPRVERYVLEFLAGFPSFPGSTPQIRLAGHGDQSAVRGCLWQASLLAERSCQPI